MRYLRCFGDVAVGAETVRTQPELVLSPQQPSDEPAPELFAFRARAGLPRQPRNIVYSLFGRLPLAHRLFTTPGIEPLVVTTPLGAAELARRWRRRRAPPPVLVDRSPGAGGPASCAYAGLFAEHGVRYLDCEGGADRAGGRCPRAGLLDEVFLTTTPFAIGRPTTPG